MGALLELSAASPVKKDDRSPKAVAVEPSLRLSKQGTNEGSTWMALRAKCTATQGGDQETFTSLTRVLLKSGIPATRSISGVLFRFASSRETMFVFNPAP